MWPFLLCSPSLLIALAPVLPLSVNESSGIEPATVSKQSKLSLMSTELGPFYKQ